MKPLVYLSCYNYVMAKDKNIQPGGVDEYIVNCPSDAQPNLKRIRSIIQELAPGSIETVSYFQIPGYSYEGYDYNGMFVWFSYKSSCVRLHLRPPVIENHKHELAKYGTTKSIVSFPINEELRAGLIKVLVEESIRVMKDNHA